MQVASIPGPWLGRGGGLDFLVWREERSVGKNDIDGLKISPFSPHHLLLLQKSVVISSFIIKHHLLLHGRRFAGYCELTR